MLSANAFKSDKSVIFLTGLLFTKRQNFGHAKLEAFADDNLNIAKMMFFSL